MADSGANMISTQQPQASQQDSLKLYVDVIFSLLPEGDMPDRNGDYKGRDLYEKVHLLHERRWESGTYKEHEIEPQSLIFIDCSELHYIEDCEKYYDIDPLDRIMLEDRYLEERINKLEETVRRIKRYMDSKITMSTAQGEIHLYVHAFCPLEPLAFALSLAFGFNLTTDKRYAINSGNKVILHSKYLAHEFEKYKSSGWKLVVDYGSVWEHKVLSAKKKPMPSKGEVDAMLFRMSQCSPMDVVEDKAHAATYTEFWYTATMLDGKYTYMKPDLIALRDYYKYGMSRSDFLESKREQEKKRDIAKLHMMLGIGSIIFMPLALVDAGVHVVESCAQGSFEGHVTDIGIDVITYVVARGLGYAALRATRATIGQERAAAQASLNTLDKNVATAEKNLARSVGEANAAAKTSANAEAEAASWSSKAELANSNRKANTYAKNAYNAESQAAVARADAVKAAGEVEQARKEAEAAHAAQAAQAAEVASLDNKIAKATSEFKADPLTFKTTLRDIYSINDMKTLWNAGKAGKLGAVGMAANTGVGQFWVAKGTKDGMTTIYDTLQYDSK